MNGRNRTAFGQCRLAIVIVVAGVFSAAAHSDSDRGIKTVATCVACHGADGIGKAPQYPNLRGQKAAYLVKQLKAFRAGTRQAPAMARMARSLSDDDIAFVADFFAALK